MRPGLDTQARRVTRQPPWRSFVDVIMKRSIAGGESGGGVGKMSGVGRLILPRNLVRAAEGEGWQGWLATALPAALGQVLQMWSLTVGEPFQPGGQTAWVAPARDAGPGTPRAPGLVLKIGWPHADAAHEADGLRAWAGNGAVRLRAAHDFGDATALLIERCVPGAPLSRQPNPNRTRWSPRCCAGSGSSPNAGHPFSSLQLMCQRWAERVRAARRGTRPGTPGPRPGPGGHRAVPRASGHRDQPGPALHRPARRQRAGRRAGAMAGHRPQAARRRPGLRPAPAHAELRRAAAGRPARAWPGGWPACSAWTRTACWLWLFARCVQESPQWPSLAAAARSPAPQARVPLRAPVSWRPRCRRRPG